jgi:hypothetical protein
MVLSMRRQNHSPLVYLVGLIAVLLIWGHRISPPGSRRSQRGI